jgi:plasmid stabilization system protein ParE
MAVSKIKIRALAAQEIIDAYDWYELQREGLGAEFLDELENLYEGLLRNPQAFSYYEKPVRQARVSRFPYVVVFEIIDHIIIVYSVFMTAQNPEKKNRK